MRSNTADKADETNDDESSSNAERTVDWLASLSDEELAEERRKAHEPISEKTHPGTGYRSAAFARWRQGIRQQAVAAESTARAVGLVNEGDSRAHPIGS